MSDFRYWQDKEMTIPAKDGDRVAVVEDTLLAERDALAGRVAHMQALDVGFGLLMSLYRRHADAARQEDEPLRQRLFALIDEFEWAFPDAKAAADARYPRAALAETQEGGR